MLGGRRQEKGTRVTGFILSVLGLDYAFPPTSATALFQ